MNRSILVLGDVFFPVNGLRTLLSMLGLRMLGPVHDLDHAAHLLRSDTPGAAVLDIELGGPFTFALADMVHAHGIPLGFVGAAGHLGSIPERHRHHPVVHKPFGVHHLERLLRDLTPARRPPTEKAAAMDTTLLHWSSRFLVGDDTIDASHHDILNSLAAFHGAIRQHDLRQAEIMVEALSDACSIHAQSEDEAFVGLDHAFPHETLDEMVGWLRTGLRHRHAPHRVFGTVRALGQALAEDIRADRRELARVAGWPEPSRNWRPPA